MATIDRAMMMEPEDFGRSLFRLGQEWRRKVDTEMQQFGLTDATWRPLFYLGRHGDGMRQKDLAALLDIEAPSLVRLLDTLESQGLLERREEGEDRRAKTVHLSPQGAATYRRLETVYARLSNRILRDVSAADMAATRRLFRRIEAAMAALEPAKTK